MSIGFILLYLTYGDSEFEFVTTDVKA